MQAGTEKMVCEAGEHAAAMCCLLHSLSSLLTFTSLCWLSPLHLCPAFFENSSNSFRGRAIRVGRVRLSATIFSVNFLHVFSFLCRFSAKFFSRFPSLAPVLLCFALITVLFAASSSPAFETVSLFRFHFLLLSIVFPHCLLFDFCFHGLLLGKLIKFSTDALIICSKSDLRLRFSQSCFASSLSRTV